MSSNNIVLEFCSILQLKDAADMLHLTTEHILN